jgi:hypothetical protein
MANSPQEEGGEAQAKPKLSLMLFSTRDVRYLRNADVEDPSNIARLIATRNIDVLGYLGWDKHFSEHGGLSRAIEDPEGTVYLALIEDDGKKKKPVAHCKIVPPGSPTVTESMAKAYFEKSAEQLIDPQTAMSVLAILSENHENNKDITEKNGVYGINPSKKGGELIQLSISPQHKHYGILFLVYLDIIRNFSENKIKELKTPSFPNVRNSSPERTQTIEQGKEDIRRVFRDIDFFFTTTWADSIPPLFIKGLDKAFELCSSHTPDGLTTYRDEMIQAENPYKKKAPPIRPDFFLKYQKYKPEHLNCQNDPVAFVMSINAMNKQGHYEILDPLLSSKWEKNTLNLWEAIFSAWRTHMNEPQNRKDPEEAHKAFIQKVSEQLSGFSVLGEAIGLGPIPVGPPLVDFNPEHPNQFRSVRTAVLPPFTMPIQNPVTYPFPSYDLADVVGAAMRRYLKDEFGIDISKIPLLNADLKPMLPEGHIEEYCRAQTAEAELIEEHLSESALAEIALAEEEAQQNPDKEKRNPIISSYRELMPPMKVRQYYLDLQRRMQVPNGNSSNSHDEGR